jgi:hypothetical protein
MSDYIRKAARKNAARAIAEYRRGHRGWDYSPWLALEAACLRLAQSAAWAVLRDDIDDARTYAQVMDELEASQRRLAARADARIAAGLAEREAARQAAA